MKVNDVLKTKTGEIFTVQRAETFGDDNVEYLLLYQVKTGDLRIGYIENNTLKLVEDTKKILKLAELFDKKKKS